MERSLAPTGRWEVLFAKREPSDTKSTRRETMNGGTLTLEVESHLMNGNSMLQGETIRIDDVAEANLADGSVLRYDNQGLAVLRQLLRP